MKSKRSKILSFAMLFAALAVTFVFAFAGFTSAYADEVATDGGSADPTQYSEVASSEVLDFLYIDSAEIAPGTDQNIVTSFNESLGTLESATLYLVDSEGEDAGEYEATTLVDAMALFTFDTSVYGGGVYSISAVEFTTTEGAYRATFDDCDVRSFTISDAISTLGLDDEADSNSNEESGVTAYSIDEDGNLVEADSISDALVDAQALTGASKSGNSSIIVALDPGHGGSLDSGAVGNGLYETNLTWKITNYCKAELENTYGLTVVLTRSENENPSLAERAARAAEAGAAVCVSIHINSGGGYGAEVWVPNNSSYNNETHAVGEQLGQQILAKITKLGLKNRGVKTRDYPSGGSKSYYSDGSTADYYGIIRECRYLNVTGIIIEHAFIDTSDSNYLNSDAKLKALGVADAQGIAQDLDILTGAGYYAPVYDYDYYIANNPDVAAAFGGDRVKTFNHFVNYGMKEGRQGCADFDVVSYFNANADLRKAYGLDLKSYYTHYVKYGKKEGRTCTGVTKLDAYTTVYDGKDYSAIYDGASYFNKYTDLQSAFSKTVGSNVLISDYALLRHFVNYGMNEGRVGSTSFDVLSYYNANQDLRAAFGTNLGKYYMHYVNYGKKEGRACTGVSELQNYRNTLDGTDYSAVYDGAYYRAKNSDLNTAFTKTVNDYKLFDDTALLRHFVSYGMKEGRVTSGSFDVVSYFNANSDLRKAYGFDYKSYFTHYMRYGKKEGRTCTGVAKLDAYTSVYNGIDYSAVYDGEYYYNNNADLRKAFSKTLDNNTLINDYALVRHFVTYGVKEGRQGNALVKATDTSIMGASKTTVSQMVAYYKKVVGESTYPSSTYKSKGAATLQQFCQIVLEEATAEGVRAEVVFCQSMLETGWLRFGGEVKASQCNFAGLGATGGGAAGATFADVRTGVRAQVQHLKAYASTADLNNACVDPRYNLVSKGCAPTVMDLSGKWAVPGTTYGMDIYALMCALLSY